MPFPPGAGAHTNRVHPIGRTNPPLRRVLRSRPTGHYDQVSTDYIAPVTRPRVHHDDVAHLHPPKVEFFDVAAMSNTDPKGFRRVVDEYRLEDWGLFMARRVDRHFQLTYVESWLLPELGLRVSRWQRKPGSPPRVRVLGPTIWCLGASGLILLGCAAIEVRRDADRWKMASGAGQGWGLDQGHFARSPPPPPTYEEADALGRRERTRTRPWEDHAAILGIIGANAVTFAAGFASPTVVAATAHVPVLPTNWTLFTSTFGHAGLLHIGVNMYALFSFGPVAGASHTFAHSGPHLTAFYAGCGFQPTAAGLLRLR